MFLLGLLRPFALKIAAGVAIALAVMALVLGIRRSGKFAERADQLVRERKAIHVRREVEDDIGRLDADARRQRLRKWADRDTL